MDAVAAGYGGPRGRPERVCRTWWILGRGKLWTHRATSEALRTPLSARLPYRVVVGLQSTNLAPNHSSHLRNPPETHRSRNAESWRPRTSIPTSRWLPLPPFCSSSPSRSPSDPVEPQSRPIVSDLRAPPRSDPRRWQQPDGAGVSKGVGGTQKANAAQRSAAFREDQTGRASASVPAATPAPPRRIDHASDSPPRTAWTSLTRAPPRPSVPPPKALPRILPPISRGAFGTPAAC
jgi:hypothetical protein